MLIRHKCVLEGNRFAGMTFFLRELAFRQDCNIEQLTENKGWLTTKILLQIVGEKDNIARFKAILDFAMERYNAEMA